MMRSTFLILVTAVFLISMKTDKPAYTLFDEKGRDASYRDLVKEASDADVVFFGELHDVSICHWLEHELMVDLYREKGKNLMMGAEMFEADNQLIINEFLAGLVKDKNFEAEARLWPNYKIDYKPLLTFARDSSLSFIATNIPRRYAALVNKGGFEALPSLDPEAKKYIAPLPVNYDPELACYKDITKEMGDMPSHVSENIAKAQAIKDATMANFILANLKPGTTFLHFNGSYHSDNFQGIVWYLKQANPKLKILTISSVQQTEIKDLDKESIGKGSYIIAIPESMNRDQ
jgi:uncharacterized iron-regulated protein